MRPKVLTFPINIVYIKKTRTFHINTYNMQSADILALHSIKYYAKITEKIKKSCMPANHLIFFSVVLIFSHFFYQERVLLLRYHHYLHWLLRKKNEKIRKRITSTSQLFPLSFVLFPIYFFPFHLIELNVGGDSHLTWPSISTTCMHTYVYYYEWHGCLLSYLFIITILILLFIFIIHFSKIITFYTEQNKTWISSHHVLFLFSCMHKIYLLMHCHGNSSLFLRCPVNILAWTFKCDNDDDDRW